MYLLNETPWIFEDQNLASALEVMTNASERTIFVLTKDYKLVGVITEGDLVDVYKKGQVASSRAIDASTTSPTYFVTPAEDLELCKLFIQTGILLVPVVDSSGILIGSQSTRMAVQRLIAELVG